MTPLPLRVGEARGVRYDEVSPELEEALPRWVETGQVAGGQELKPQRLYRVGNLGVKFYRGGHSWRERLRASPARRCADQHRRLLPIPSPAPVVVLEWASRRARHSVIVYHWLEGRHLYEIWTGDAGPVEAYPAFLADMHSRGIDHGDLHLANTLWTGRRWGLLDLDGLRHPLQRLSRTAMIEDHWSRTFVGLAVRYESYEPELRALFDRYVELTGRPRDPDRSWSRIRSRGKEHERRWREGARARGTP